MNNNTIDATLLNSEVAISNARSNPTILASISVLGYNEARLDEGKALLEDAQVKQSKQKKEYGEQYEATDVLNMAKAAANKMYMKHVKLARIAFKNQRGVFEALQLEGRRKKTYSGWIKQSSVFYTNALGNAAIIAGMSRFGILEAELTGAQGSVKDVQQKLADQLKEKGEAQEATQLRDEALDNLEDWMSDFVEVSRIALEEQPQMLEALGIVTPS